MKQIEITVRLNEDKKTAMEKLSKLGYKVIRQSDVDDIYMTTKLDELNLKNIQYILKKSLLLRKLNVSGKEIKKITYKNKEIDSQGNVISEQKVNLDCEDIAKAKELLSYVDFRELVRVKYHVTVYEKDGIEFAFQDVENLGTLIEYENKDDFEGKSIEEINNTKKNMYNDIKKTGILITDELDVKKAYELIMKKEN